MSLEEKAMWFLYKTRPEPRPIRLPRQYPPNKDTYVYIHRCQSDDNEDQFLWYVGKTVHPQVRFTQGYSFDAANYFRGRRESIWKDGTECGWHIYKTFFLTTKGNWWSAKFEEERISFDVDGFQVEEGGEVVFPQGEGLLFSREYAAQIEAFLINLWWPVLLNKICPQYEIQHHRWEDCPLNEFEDISLRVEEALQHA